MKSNLLVKTVYSINPKTIASLCAVMLLICGIQGVGYAAPPVFATGNDTRTVDENAPNTNVGAVIPVTDADGDTLTYKLEDPDSAPFTAVAVPTGDTTGVQLKTKPGAAGTLDFENPSDTDGNNVAGNGTYAVTIIASDGTGNNIEQTVTITVNNKNEAPTFTDGATARRSIAEDVDPTDTTDGANNVGDVVSATDPDGTTDVNPDIPGEEPNLTYTLDAATVTEGVFEIGVNTGQLTLASALDYETKGIYQVTITVSDGPSTDSDTLTDTIKVTITVTDANDLPMFPDNDNDPANTKTADREIGEHATAGENIGDAVEATDDDRDTLTYTLGGTNAASFAIDRNTGQLKTKAALNFEGAVSSYTVIVEVSDGEGSDTITVTINVTNENDVPVFTHGDSTSRTIAEGTGTPARDITDAVVTNGESGAVVATDPDGTTDANPEITGNSSLTYVLGGTDAASFGIVADTGVLQTKADLDYETKSSYKVTVTVYDGPSTDSKTGSDTINVTIRVTDENDAPVFPSATTTRSVPEETGVNVDIGAPISATDQDSGDTLRYSITAGDTNNNFDIDVSTGQLKTAESAVDLEYDGDVTRSYSLTVEVTDNASTPAIATITVTVNVTPVNEAPTADSLAVTRTIDENTPSGRNIQAPVTATDPEGDTLTYTLGGTDAGSFAIDSGTGQLKTKAALDYEARTDYEVTVTATDPNGLSVTITVTITVNNVTGTTDPNDGTAPPAFPGPSASRSVPENTGAGEDIPGGAVVATGGTAPLTHKLGGTDAASFAIDSGTGQLQTKAALDYETKSSYTVTVTVTDSTTPTALTDTIKVTITVTPVDEPPVFSEDSPTRTVAENTVAGVNIGAPISATDPEGAEVTYSIPTTGDDENFAIDTKTGQLKTKEPLDYEDVNNLDRSYTVTVTATDGGGASTPATSSVTINVTDVNDPPVFGTITALSIPENTAAGQNVGNLVPMSDPDGDDLTYSLGGPDGSSFGFEKMVGTTPAENGVQLKTKAALDFETKADYDVTIIATDGKGGRATAEVVITVTNIGDAAPANSAPIFPSVGGEYEVAENGENNVAGGILNTLSGDLAAVDTNPASDATALTYTLGGPDAALFKFDSANTQLQIKTPLDYETKASYMVTVTATDPGGLTDTIRLTISVNDVNEAPMFPEETVTFASVAEDTAAGVVIGTVPMATDPDEGDILTYTVANPMGFEFDGDTRQLKIRSPLDYEFSAKHVVTVTATDDDATDPLPGTIKVTINVTDVNEAPMFASDSTAHTVVENRAANTNIGSPVKATDPDAGDTLTYTLGGPDRSSFDIESSATDGGQLKTKAALDFETKTDYEVKIIVTDRDGLTDEMTVTINIGNDPSDDSAVTNRPPVFSAPLDVSPVVSTSGRSVTYEVLENTAAGHNLGTIRATDPEDTVTYTLGGTDSASFEFDSTLEQLKTAVALNYEAKASYTATITASDGNGGTDVIVIVLNVLNVNEAPTFNSGQDTTHAVDENTAAGMTVGGTYPATDPDAGDTLTYSIGGPDGGFFAIDEDTGQLKTKAALDHETADTRMVTVTVEDSRSLTSELAVTITIRDVNEAPMFPADADTTLFVEENDADEDLVTESAGSIVGMYIATDPDDGATLRYSLGGPDGGSFAKADLDDGGIKLKTVAALDYETSQTDYEVKITVSDGSLTDSVTVVITVTDDTNEANEPTNNPPVFGNGPSATREVYENTPADKDIGDLLGATDADGNDLSYSLGGVDGGSFAITKATNGVQLKTKAVLNYEAVPKKTTYMVTITASDGVLRDRIRVTITLMDVNEPPVFSAGTSTNRSIQENVGKGASIGRAVSATDPDGGKLNYKLEGSDAAAFDINVENGQLRTKTELDRETKSSYTVTVVASDGALEARITVTITVGDENDAPMYADDEVERSVAERTDPNMEFGAPVAATDPDADTLEYSVSGTDFGIDSATGKLKTRAALDYETRTDYEVTVTATDPDGLSDTIRVVIKVTDVTTGDEAVVNSAPYFDAGPRDMFTVNENKGPGDPIGDKITATDPDTDDVLTYALGGTDAASFDHDADGTGLQLKVKEGVLDYETKTDYEVTVTVRDSKNAAGTADSAVDDSIIITIEVENDPDDDDPESNRAPYFTSTSTTRTVDAGTGVRDILPEVIATDPEEDTLEYSITGGTDRSRFTIVSTTGKLRTAVALTGGDTHEVIVGVTDNKGPTGDANATIDDTITVTISVTAEDTDQNDPPTFNAGTSVSYSIQQGASGRTVGTPAATDPDGDPLTYAITGGNTGGLFAIDTATGRLSTALAVTASSHSLTVTVSDLKDVNGNADPVVDDTITVSISVTTQAQPPPDTGTGGTPAPQPLPEGTPGTPGTIPPVTNDPPTFDDGTSATRSVAENTPAGTNIGTPVGATDPNNDPLTYTLTGTDAASFSIDGTSGQLMTSAALDFEVKNVYTVTVTANDGLTGGTASIPVTINVTDVSVAEGDPVPTNTAPAFASATAARSVAENTAAGGNIGAPVAAVDTDTGEVLTYTLSGTDAASFGINAATGQLMTKVALDHETKASYTVVVTATDSGGLTDSITVTITVTDVNEAPAFADATAARSVAENTAAGMAIGDAFTATDPDDGDAVTYSVGGTDMGSFAIGETTGQLMTMGMLDHETKASYTVMVIATDSGGLTGSITVTISVMDVNDAPRFASDTATRMVEENTAAGMAIGDPVTAMDDDGDDVTYSLGGTDMGSFALDTATGQLKTMADLDYEAQASHTVTVTASDGTLMSSVTVTIMVTDVPEFMLSVPSGQSLIHVPLKMAGLAKISDLYDKLGGATNVNLLVTYDAANQRWLSYIGDQNRGGASDRDLTDDLGILADMKNAVTVQLSGDALGTNGTASIMLQAGNNLVGVPLKDSRITNVSDLLGLDDNISFIIVSDGGEYKTITRAGDPGDVAVTGGQAFILNATAAATVTITGDGWASSTATSAPSWMSQMGIQKDGMTAALAVTGSIVDEVKGLTDFHITVKNLSTGKVDTVATDANGAGYQLTFVDIETGRAAQIGDTLEITAQAADPLVGVEPLRYVVTVEDVKRGHIQLDALVTYEVPAKTELLRNYPNPFNPETWIPYRLAEAATVTLTIYNQNGGVVRDIHLGHQIAAVYETRSKAIYWDGRNNLGERVASGIYFYHLTAGDYSAVRKMVIVK